jgi:hypothetical protein
MKRLKAGPELKMPELKVPPFLVDLYWDLRDRRLLPLAGLIVVAILAAPFLLGGGSKEAPSAGPAAVAAVPGETATGSEASTLTVVQAKPGLREYSKRLDHRKPTDPFKQRYTSPPPSQAGPELGPETSSEGSGSSGSSETSTHSLSPETTTTSVPSSTSESSPGGSPSKSGAGSVPPGHLTLFAFAISVKVTRTEGGEGNSQPKSESSTRHKVMPTTTLPGEKAPVVTYMGVGKGAKDALLMVSNNVKSIYGDAKCLSGTDTCQLLEVEPGLPETFVYGPNDVRYKINVLKIEPVIIGHK